MLGPNIYSGSEIYDIRFHYSFVEEVYVSSFCMSDYTLKFEKHVSGSTIRMLRPSYLFEERLIRFRILDDATLYHWRKPFLADSCVS